MHRNLVPQLFLVCIVILLLTVLLNNTFAFVFSQKTPTQRERIVTHVYLSTTTERSASSISKPFYVVTHVVDGDTIDISLDGVKTRVRLIGINTPETVDPRHPVQCFGREASARAKELLLNKEVYIESDPSQDTHDKYGRLLAYVYLPDGIFFNKLMIEEGYAHEYTYHTPYAYQREFKEAEHEARTNKRGLWADGVCGETYANSTSVQ